MSIENTQKDQVSSVTAGRLKRVVIHLLPCPFCGWKPDGPAGWVDNMITIVCGNAACSCEIQLPNPEVMAVTAWNSRCVPVDAIKDALWWLQDGLDNADMSYIQFLRTANAKKKIEVWLRSLER